MFKQFKTQQQNRVKELLAGNTPVFTTDISGDEMWQAYLGAFPEAERQGHNCNCCRSFIKHYGNMVTIVDNKVQTIWSFTTDVVEYQASIKALDILVSSKSINNIFIAEQSNVGTDYNFEQSKEGGSPIRWDHFSLLLPSSLVKNNILSIDSIKGSHRDCRNVFKRSLDELTIDSTETILELISQNSLYRGEEYKSMLTAFLKVQKIYSTIKPEEKDNFVWSQSEASGNSFITKIRNTAIGTMLEDISENVELDIAVAKFEKLMAPANYKRPTAIFTKKMAMEAEAKLDELGLLSALPRRFATTDDITVDNLLFVDREKKKESSVFETLADEQSVNPKSLSKVETVTIEEFINNILPNSKSTEILLENKHEPNLVSLIAPVEKESASMFKWDNRFSWSYNNAMADSMRERVVAAGGRVDGVFRFTHSWNELEPNQSLMDLHVFMPGNNHISDDRCHQTYGTGRRVGWNNRTDGASGGKQDVDYVEAAPSGYVPIENITFPSLSKMPEGKYICKIHNWSFRGTGGKGKAEIEIGGEIFQYIYPATKNHQWITIAEVTLKDGQFTIKHCLDNTSISKDLWKLKTNRFQKVKSIMYSPNFWDGQQGIGNKHVFLMLDGAENTGMVRGFFNEYLKPDLDKHRKVFEALASKVTVQPTVNQLSGVGFSTTSKNEFYCKVTGKFTRTIKVVI